MPVPLPTIVGAHALAGVSSNSGDDVCDEALEYQRHDSCDVDEALTGPAIKGMRRGPDFANPLAVRSMWQRNCDDT